VSNLTDEPALSLVNGNPSQPSQFFEYGRNYLLGINYKF